MTDATTREGYEPLTDDTIAAIRDVFDTAVREEKLAGVAWGVVRDGEVLVSGGSGVSHLVDGKEASGSFAPAQNSISRIASMTKSFTAATILALRDEGKLRLDDPVAQYVPEAAEIGKASEDSPEITIRHLLTMSAGFVTDNPWGDRQESMTREEFAQILKGGLAFVAEPGCGFEYSNTGYVLLGRIIDEVTGSDYTEQIRTRFLEPLGMKDSFFSLAEATDDQRARLLEGHRVSDAEGLAKFERVTTDNPGVFGAMAGLFSTVEDVTKWVQFLSEVGTGRGLDEHRALLSVASRREMQEIHRIQEWPALPENAGYARVRGYGYGLVVERFPLLGDVIGHSGGYPGYGSYMVWLRHSGLAVIALANSKYAPAIALSIKTLETIAEKQPELVGKKRVELSDSASAALDAALAWLREGKLDGAYGELIPDGTEGAVAELSRNAGLAEADGGIGAFFASNMDQDVSRAERLRLRDAALKISGLTHADLTREKATVAAVSPYQARVDFEGPTGSIRVDLLMDPRKDGKIQALNVKGTPKESGAESGGAPIGI